MKKITFVCHANICRSPTAEYIMKAIVRNAGKENEYDINSASTRVFEGCRIYPCTRKELDRRGIEYDYARKSVRIRKKDYAERDMFIVMDEKNVRDLIKKFGNDDARKIRKLLDFTPDGGDVADPWRTRKFDVAFDEIERGCKALFLYLEERFT